MAAANIVNPQGTNGFREGFLNFDMGRLCGWGRATFTTTATTCTIPPRNGKQVDLVFLTAGTSGVVGLSYSIGSDGTITVTRTDTTSGGEFSFLIVYGG